MDDIFEIGKILPLDKLVIEVSKGVGRISKSYFDRKDIKNEAFRIRTLAVANMDALEMISKRNVPNLGLKEFETDGGNLKISAFPIPKIENLPNDDLIARTNNRILNRETKKQQNLESITSIAAEQLKSEPEVDNTPVNETWLNRFLNIAEEVSDTELQDLWGRILAGEVKSPNSYSLRTLDVIKNLSKSDAELITKISCYTGRIIDDFFLFNDEDALEQFGVRYSMDIPYLVEIGILQSTQGYQFTIESFSAGIPFGFTAGKYFFQMDRRGEKKFKNVPILKFTKAGVDILKILTINSNFDFFISALSKLKVEGITMSYFLIKYYEGTMPIHDGYIPF